MGQSESFLQKPSFKGQTGVSDKSQIPDIHGKEYISFTNFFLVERFLCSNILKSAASSISLVFGYFPHNVDVCTCPYTGAEKWTSLFFQSPSFVLCLLPSFSLHLVLSLLHFPRCAHFFFCSQRWVSCEALGRAQHFKTKRDQSVEDPVAFLANVSLNVLFQTYTRFSFIYCNNLTSLLVVTQTFNCRTDDRSFAFQ